jgi:hypothetical protein
VSTAYGVQVAAADNTAGTGAGSDGAAMPMRTAGPALGVAAAAIGIAAAVL